MEIGKHILLKTIQGRVQTFLTTPGLNDITQQLIKEPKIFHIDDGQISENSEMAEITSTGFQKMKIKLLHFIQRMKIQERTVYIEM